MSYGKVWTHPLQAIYDSLVAIPDIHLAAADPLACPELTRVRQELKRLSLQDVGLTTKVDEVVKIPMCTTVYQCDAFALCVFLLPPGQSLPLHDHPHMAVLSHILRGRLSLRAYSAVDGRDGCFAGATCRLTTVTDVSAGAVESPSEPWLLTPTHNNVHSFTSTHATQCCVVFDVLLPPYSSSVTESGRAGSDHEIRVCTYYEAQPVVVNDRDGETNGGEDKNGGSEGLVKLREVVPTGPLPGGFAYSGMTLKLHS